MVWGYRSAPAPLAQLLRFLQRHRALRIFRQRELQQLEIGIERRRQLLGLLAAESIRALLQESVEHAAARAGELAAREVVAFVQPHRFAEEIEGRFVIARREPAAALHQLSACLRPRLGGPEREHRREAAARLVEPRGGDVRAPERDQAIAIDRLHRLGGALQLLAVRLEGRELLEELVSRDRLSYLQEPERLVGDQLQLLLLGLHLGERRLDGVAVRIVAARQAQIVISLPEILGRARRRLREEQLGALDLRLAKRGGDIFITRRLAVGGGEQVDGVLVVAARQRIAAGPILRGHAGSRGDQQDQGELRMAVRRCHR
jgi:hypothetical protein